MADELSQEHKETLESIETAKGELEKALDEVPENSPEHKKIEDVLYRLDEIEDYLDDIFYHIVGFIEDLAETSDHDVESSETSTIDAGESALESVEPKVTKPSSESKPYKKFTFRKKR